MKLMLVTSDPLAATEAQAAGIDRIFLDLEYIHKRERQRGRDTWISSSKMEDVTAVKRVMTSAALLVRVNPMNPNSKAEIDRVIALGAEIVMLPMILDAEDVEQFVAFVGKRARVCLLIETAQALARLDDILAVPEIDEVFIGLNDLHIGMGLTFMFELLSGGIIEYMCNKIKRRGIPFGFGGMAKIGEGRLPAEYILAEHHRLGSSSVILSREFRKGYADCEQGIRLKFEVEKIRQKEKEILTWDAGAFLENKDRVRACVRKIVSE